jgi:hypothetical protein
MHRLFLSQIIDKQRQQIEALAGKPANLRRLVNKAREGEIPVMPLRNSPETGVVIMGLPIPKMLRERLLTQKQSLNLRSYKAAIFVALRVGLEILETLDIPEEKEEE